MSQFNDAQLNDYEPDGAKSSSRCWSCWGDWVIWQPFRFIYRILAWEPHTPKDSVPWWLFFKNRWVRAIVYLVACVTSTLIYYGWQHFSFMLMRHGVYRWLCTEEELADMGIDDACDAQRSALRTMFFVGTSSEFVLGVLAGLSFDHIGPALTVVFGYISFVLGWVFLVVSSKTVQLYIPAMVLMAGSTNLIAFPALCLQDFFPSRAGLAASLVVAAQTMGTLVTPVMWATWNANQSWVLGQLVGGYLGFIVLPIALLYALCLPIKRPALRQTSGEPPPVLESVESRESLKPALNESVIETPGSANDATLPSTTMGTPVAHAKNCVNKSVDTDTERVGRAEHLEPAGIDEIEPEPQAKYRVDENQDYESTVNINDGPTGAASSTTKGLSIWRQLATMDYILFTIAYVLPLFNYGYYNSILEERSGRHVANLQGIILPTQGVFGAAFGLVVDYTKTIPICYVLSACVMLKYCFILTYVVPLHYIATVLFVISNSFIYTVKYTYVQEMYPPRHFGFLSGLMGCVAGAITLLNIVIERMTFQSAVILNLSFVALTFALLIFLHIRQLRGVHYRILPPSGNGH